EGGPEYATAVPVHRRSARGTSRLLPTGDQRTGRPRPTRRVAGQPALPGISQPALRHDAGSGHEGAPRRARVGAEAVHDRLANAGARTRPARPSGHADAVGAIRAAAIL